MDDIRNRGVRTPAGRGSGFFAQDWQKLAFFLMLLWCLLPLVMCVDYVVSGMLGRYSTLEELRQQGLSLGYVNYDEALGDYQKFFFALGGITLCFDLICLILSRRRVFSLASVRKKPWFYLFGLFLLWAFVCAELSDYRRYALYGSDYLRDGLTSYLVYGAVFLCASMIQNIALRRRILQVFAAVISFLALVMLIQENVENDFINYCFSSRRAVVFNQFNHFGYMLCMAAVTALGLFLFDRGAKRGLKCLYLADFFYLVYALVVNDTFGALLAVVVALPVVFIFYARTGGKLNLRALAIVLALAILLGVCFFALTPIGKSVLENFTHLIRDVGKILTNAEDAGNAGTDRFGLWQQTVEKISKRPIFGYGPEGLIRRHALSEGRMPHNAYLQIAAYTGIPGFVLYLLAIVSLAVHHLKRLKMLDAMVLTASGAAFAYMASAFVGVPVFNTEPYFWLFLGLVTVGTEWEKPLICPEANRQP